MAHAPKRLVSPVEYEIPDARVLEKDFRFASIAIEGDDVAIVVVVGGVEDRARLGIPGDRDDLVQGRPLDFLDLLGLAAVQGDGANVRDDARVLESGNQRLRFFVDKRPGHRTKRFGDERFVFRERILAHRLEVAGLECFLERDPVLPDVVEGLAEHALEVLAVGAMAALVPFYPRDDFFR